MTRLSATQRQVLGDLAAGGWIVEGTGRESGTYTLYRNDPSPHWYTVRWATLHALRQGIEPLIAQEPNTYPHEYRITAAGQRAWAALASPEVQL